MRGKIKTRPTKKSAARCGTKPASRERPLLSPILAGDLAVVLNVLAIDARLRLLHDWVRADELCSTELAGSVGMKQQAGSNQFQRLSDRHILASRREGISICDRLVDHCIRSLLDQEPCLMEKVHDRSPDRVRTNFV